MSLGSTTPTVSPCWKVKIIWSPTSETFAAVIYSLYFILYFIQPIIYLCPGTWRQDLPSGSVFQITTGSAARPPPTIQLKPYVDPVGRSLVRWSWDVAGSLIPTLWEMRFSCSPSCSCNFDQALMWLVSDPDMTSPGTCKESLGRGAGGASWSDQ